MTLNAFITMVIDVYLFQTKESNFLRFMLTVSQERIKNPQIWPKKATNLTVKGESHHPRETLARERVPKKINVFLGLMVLWPL